MKIRTRNANPVEEKTLTKTDHGEPPTPEEIRQRAHEIFMARGGAPGNELEDWLRAEQQLKQQRDGANTDATSGAWEGLDVKPGSISRQNSRPSPARERTHRAVRMLGAIGLILLLNGCASMATSDDLDSYKYNPNTDYPAVGGPTYGHF